MSALVDYGDVWVCTDCYFAHHYGCHEDPERKGVWWVGDIDTPDEPLRYLDGFEVTDNTDSETGEGIDEFSMSSCEGCHSHLGGSRYRLHLFKR